MHTSRKLKIAFVSSNDALDKRSLSGSSYICAELLSKYCGEVEYIHKLRPNKIIFGYMVKNFFREFTWIYILQKSKELFWKFFGKTFIWEKTPLVSRYYAKRIKEQLEGKDYNVIFADKGSFCLAYLNTNIPIIYQTDATFKAMENYYPEFMNPAKSFSLGGNAVEKKALEKSSLVIATSHWAANSMIRDYGISKEKIKVLFQPVMIDTMLSEDIIAQQKDHNLCKLLFIGVDWKRKGGDIAVEAVNWLNNQGVHSKLTICGCIPPKRYFSNEYLDIIEFLDKNVPADKKKLEELFRYSNFLILPTRAECLAQVFCEASAFGLPIIATETGGVSSAVFDGQNGFLLDIKAKGSEYGEIIKEIWNDKARYNDICVNARRIFKEKFSPESWNASINTEIHRLLTKTAKSGGLQNSQ